jgi:hypothetical protein
MMIVCGKPLHIHHEKTKASWILEKVLKQVHAQSKMQKGLRPRSVDPIHRKSSLDLIRRDPIQRRAVSRPIITHNT